MKEPSLSSHFLSYSYDLDDLIRHSSISFPS
jgi:hypothetical protein